MAVEQQSAPAPGAGAPAETIRTQVAPSTTGVGLGDSQANRSRAPRGLVGLVCAMQTLRELLVTRKFLELGWSRRRIAAELGISSRNTLLQGIRQALLLD